jgi:brefeldin A-resistance guanine nucleotide exchange factor 1
LYQSDEDEDTLIRSLKQLDDRLSYATDINFVDTCSYTDPFLDVIVSDRANAHATAIALQSIHKFLVYGHINIDSPHVDEAIGNVVRHVTRCVFDVNRREEAEVVYVKILEVLLECLRSSAGELLSNDAVCSMIT